MSSLRGVGYSLETAIADIIDNSIAAGAGLIEIGLSWAEGDPIITILDDGSGMSDAELLEAMRFGGVGPSAQRSSEDFGRRFGCSASKTAFAFPVPSTDRRLEGPEKSGTVLRRSRGMWITSWKGTADGTFWMGWPTCRKALLLLFGLWPVGRL